MGYFLRFFMSSLLCFVLNYGPVLHAQTQIIGTVIDSDTNEPLIGAQVFADGTPAFAETDENGKFDLHIPYNKDQFYQLVRIQYLGYNEYSDFVKTTMNGDLLRLKETYFLKSQAVKLEDVVVTANKVEEIL